MKLPILAALILTLFIAPQQAPAPSGGLPLCTPAQHAKYQITGPDGLMYPTWHPLVDYTAGCIHSHEHGSDPAAVMPGYRPLFGYTAAAHGMPEPHHGFKGYAFELDGRRWYITHHQGTASASTAACLEHHTLDIAIWEAGAIVADLHLMPSFGRARINETNAEITACPQTSTSGGVRLFPNASAGNIGYGPWRTGWQGAPPFIRYGDLTFNALNPQTACADATCAASVPRTDAANYGGPATGAMRFLKLEGNNEFWLHSTAEQAGTFTWAGAQQYIQPGLDLHVPPAECWPFTSAMLYQCARSTALRPHVNEAQYRRLPVLGSN